MIFYLPNFRFINEISFIKDRQKNYLITVDLSDSQISGFLLAPYFKIYNRSDQRLAPNESRISLVDASFIDHEGKPALKINREIKDYIIAAFRGNVNIGKYKNKPVFESIWDFLNKEGAMRNLQVADKPDMETYLKMIEERDYNAEIK